MVLDAAAHLERRQAAKKSLRAAHIDLYAAQMDVRLSRAELHHSQIKLKVTEKQYWERHWKSLSPSYQDPKEPQYLGQRKTQVANAEAKYQEAKDHLKEAQEKLISASKRMEACCRSSLVAVPRCAE